MLRCRFFLFYSAVFVIFTKPHVHDSKLQPYSCASLFVIVIGDGGNSFLAKLNVAYACDVFVTSSLTM